MRFHNGEVTPAVLSLCPGYESGKWREDPLAEDVFDRHLISFAASYSSYIEIDDQNAIAVAKAAARSVYKTQNYKGRGEFGELLLHAVLRDVFDSVPAISKIWFKDSANDTVKGFDAVHIVANGDDYELWLGEVKFYTEIKRAIRDVIAELRAHLEGQYLRDEFLFVSRKLDEGWPFVNKVRELMESTKSLDAIFPTVTVPILLTYESSTVADNSKLCDSYSEQIAAEAMSAWSYLSDRIDSNWKVRLRVILLPLRSKGDLRDNFHERLIKWQ